MCLVSVLVPIYGVEQYIERCARSLFEQTYPNIEFVFVNDCTRDRSIEILLQVLKDYPHRAEMVKLISHDCNRGIASTRNTAMNNATGEFVSYVDSDDWLEPNAIELLVKRQIETRADIVSGNMYIHSHEGVIEFVQPKYDNKEQMLLMQFPPTHDHDLFRRIIRRSLYEDNSIRCIDGCDMGEDRYLMVQLCYLAKEISTTNDFVYNYNTYNSNSYTHQIQPEKRLALIEQSLNNYLGIRRFLCDKEETLFQGTTKYVVVFIESLLKLSIRHRRKDLYRRVVKIIGENEDCMNVMRWKKKGVKNRIKHNYHYLVVKDCSKKLVRRIQSVL